MVIEPKKNAELEIKFKLEIDNFMIIESSYKAIYNVNKCIKSEVTS
jgi:hypothetical protein